MSNLKDSNMDLSADGPVGSVGGRRPSTLPTGRNYSPPCLTQLPHFAENRKTHQYVRWPALSEQCFAFDKWNRCRFPLRCAFVGVSRMEGVARPE